MPEDNVIQLDLFKPIPENDDNKLRLYVAGPMTGIEDYNRPAFYDTAEAFRDGGYVVFNPADNDVRLFGSHEACDEAINEDRQGALRIMLGSDLEFITQEADVIAMLPGWENSKGARAEHATAVALGLEIIYLHS